MQFNRKTFFNEYRRQFRPLEYQSQTDGLNALLTAMEADVKLTDVRVAAYMLATVHHECQLPFNKIWKPTYLPVEENGRGRGRKYDKSYPVSRRDGVTRVTYYGRGYVQLTWLDNYRKASNVIGVDLVTYPEQALVPEIAYQCLSMGLRLGWYGAKIGTYINGAKCDYKGARRCVNIQDKAEQIAEYARKFELVLRTATVPAGESQRQADAVPAPLINNFVASDAVQTDGGTTAPDGAKEGTPAPENAAKKDEAIVGGRPDDPPVIIQPVQAQLAPEPTLEEKAQKAVTSVKAWHASISAPIGAFCAWSAAKFAGMDAATLIPITIGIFVVASLLAMGIVYLKNQREKRADEAKKRADDLIEAEKQRAFELTKLQMTITADPTKYNVVVATQSPAVGQ